MAHILLKRSNSLFSAFSSTLPSAILVLRTKFPLLLPSLRNPYMRPSSSCVIPINVRGTPVTHHINFSNSHPSSPSNLSYLFLNGRWILLVAWYLNWKIHTWKTAVLKSLVSYHKVANRVHWSIWLGERELIVPFSFYSWLVAEIRLKAKLEKASYDCSKMWRKGFGGAEDNRRDCPNYPTWMFFF
jgi:hypothetical protein